MSARDKLIKARLGMLALAEEFQNITPACRRAGISRSHHCEIKQAFEKFGTEGLAPRLRRKPRMPNQTPPALEQQILEMTERCPTASYLRIAQHLLDLLMGAGHRGTVRATVQTSRPVANLETCPVRSTDGHYSHGTDPASFIPGLSRKSMTEFR